MRTKKNFPAHANLLLPEDDFYKLIAMAYFNGDKKGKYAGPARSLIAQGILNFEKGLSPKKKKEFEEILTNVKITARSAANNFRGQKVYP